MYLRPVALAMDWPNEVLPTPAAPPQTQDLAPDFIYTALNREIHDVRPRTQTIMVSIEDFLRPTQVFLTRYAHSTAHPHHPADVKPRTSF